MTAVTPNLVALRVLSELEAAQALFHPMASAHEGIAVIREEYLELERHVFGDTGRSPEAIEEAVQLAAMAMRYVVDITPVKP